MFGKDKKDKPTTFYATDTEAEHNMADVKRLVEENARLLRNVNISRATESSLREMVSRYTPAYSSTTSTTSYAEDAYGPSLMDVYNLCFEIRNNITGYMNVLESVSYITKALEARECPVDDCKKCKYYQPGNVEKCDTNRMIAEYLVNGEFVRGIRPKPIDKSEEK